MDQFEKKADLVERPTTIPSMRRENPNLSNSDESHNEQSGSDGLSTTTTVVASASARVWDHVAPPQRRMRDRNADSMARSQPIAPSTTLDPQAQSQSYQHILQVLLQGRGLQHTFSVDCTLPPSPEMWKAQLFIQSSMVAESGWSMDKNTAKEEAARLTLEGMYADS